MVHFYVMYQEHPFHPFILHPKHVSVVDTNGKLFLIVVSQSYEAEADNEYVIRGNAAVMKCEVPSFVSDFVYVEMWTDSDGGTYYPGHNEGKTSRRSAFHFLYPITFVFS